MKKLEKKLNGNSICLLTLYEGQDGIFVRKLAKNPEYNPRLKKQFIKQKIFGQWNR